MANPNIYMRSGTPAIQWPKYRINYCIDTDRDALLQEWTLPEYRENELVSDECNVARPRDDGFKCSPLRKSFRFSYFIDKKFRHSYPDGKLDRRIEVVCENHLDQLVALDGVDLVEPDDPGMGVIPRELFESKEKQRS